MPKNRRERAGLRAAVAGNTSHDLFGALIGAWWALRRAKKSEQRLVESLARMHETGEALWGSQPGAPRLPPAPRQRTGDPLLKHVVLHGALLMLRPLLVVLAYGAVLWALWELFWWLI